MGGLGPGIGGLEYLLIAVVALLVLGPERLPGMLNKLGKWVAKARGMANEFRASFDEMARQSELDELRKEVDALRRGQGMVPLGAEADAAFKDIRDEMNRPLLPPAAPVAQVDEWPDASAAAQAEPAPAALPKPRKPRAKKAASTPAKGKVPAKEKAPATPKATRKPAAAKPRPARGKAADQ